VFSKQICGSTETRNVRNGSKWLTRAVAVELMSLFNGAIRRENDNQIVDKLL